MTTTEYNNAVRQYAAALHRHAYRTLRDDAAAKDVVQDVFERVWKKCKKIDPQSIKPYLYRATMNACLDHIKKHKSTTILPPDQMSWESTGSSEDQDAFEYDNMFEASLNTLSPQYRSLIMLRDVEGYSYEEIAAISELSLSQVKVYLFRARKSLKHHLSNEMIL